MNKSFMNKRAIVAVVAALGLTVEAAEFKKDGNWRLSFDEATQMLTMENAARGVVLEGRAAFVEDGREWKLSLARDAVQDRLSLVRLPREAVHGFVAFDVEGDRVEVLPFPRHGSFPCAGRLKLDLKARVREDSFPCRTHPVAGERVIGFADGAGDSTRNDSVFAWKEDLALRFESMATRVASCGVGAYDVHLEADAADPAAQRLCVEAKEGYFHKSWAPAYHPIDRARCPRAPTGWMSWNIYFDKAGSAENLAEARIAAKYLKPFGLEIWSIESWQDNSLWLPVANFHNLDLSVYTPQFPEGMKWLADEIRKLGFRPGLWMPLYATGDEKFFREHEDLFVHDDAGKPVRCWNGRFTLDMTNPKSLDLMRSLARTAAQDWGYEFFKFDGMGNTGVDFETPEKRRLLVDKKDPLWWDNTVRALREGIGEKSIMLGCSGFPTCSEAKYIDATRLGGDVVGCYSGIGENYNPGGSSDCAQMPVRWRNVMNQVTTTLSQVYVNGLMLYTDPDTLMVGYSLETHEAEVMATVVGLPGQLMFNGDKLGCLREDRVKMIQQVLPVADIHPQNLYPFDPSDPAPVWRLTVTRPFGTWHVVAVFNFTDGPASRDIPLADLGLDETKRYEAFEFWGQSCAGTFERSLVVKNQPMRSVKLFAVREATDHPQFVGDDRHITQGAVEISDLAWDEATATYSLTAKAVAGFPFVYSVRVPEGYRFLSAKAEGGAVTAKMDGSLLKLTVSSETSGDVTVRATFGK